MTVQNNIDDLYLFKDILNRNYFDDFKRGKKNIEFLLNNECPHNCQNCHVNYDKEIYKNQNIFSPKNNKYDNLLFLIDWYIENQFHCDMIFKGCIEENPEKDIIDIFTKMYNKFNNSPSHPGRIYIHTKGLNIPLLDKIILLFRKIQIGVIPIFDINGYYCDDVIYNKQIIDYIKNNDECQVYSYINATNVYNWIQNYKWWILSIGFENCHKIHLIETLDDSWDADSIQEYLNFLNFQIDFLMDNLIDFQDIIFSNKKINFCTIQLQNQQILSNKKYYQDCLFHNGITIDLITLKVPACSKLNYPIFHVGEFIYNEEHNKLELQPLNLTLLIPKAHLKKSCTPHCEYCDCINLCEKTCYGENFKVSYNPLCPIKHSCDLIKSKYHFLIYKYNLLELLNFDLFDLDYSFVKNLIKLKNQNIFINKKEDPYEKDIG